jgi:hypothetical protein
VIFIEETPETNEFSQGHVGSAKAPARRGKKYHETNFTSLSYADDEKRVV